MKPKLTAQEKRILEDFNKDEFISDKDFAKNNKTYQTVALNTLKKNNYENRYR